MDETEKLLMTSICFPIFDDTNNVIGIAGIDILMDDIINMIENQNPYGIKHATLITENNNIISHYDTSMFGKHFSSEYIFESGSFSWDEIAPRVQNRETFSFIGFDKYNNKNIVFFIPAEFGETDSFLTLMITFDYRDAMSKARSFALEIALYFLLALFLITVAILFSTALLYNAAFNRATSYASTNNENT
jgi:hypothetical protein